MIAIARDLPYFLLTPVGILRAEHLGGLPSASAGRRRRLGIGSRPLIGALSLDLKGQRVGGGQVEQSVGMRLDKQTTSDKAG